MKKRIIYLGADHAGFDLKERIKEHLKENKILYEDLGTDGRDSADDYPDYALEVGNKVIKNKGSRGILICGTGIGVCITANKITGIRAALILDEYTAKMSREHNDVNIMCLRGRDFDYDFALKLVDLWLNTEFSKEERHKRRLKKIKKIERRK